MQNSYSLVKKLPCHGVSSYSNEPNICLTKKSAVDWIQGNYFTFVSVHLQIRYDWDQICIFCKSTSGALPNELRGQRLFLVDVTSQVKTFFNKKFIHSKIMHT